MFLQPALFHQVELDLDLVQVDVFATLPQDNHGRAMVGDDAFPSTNHGTLFYDMRAC